MSKWSKRHPIHFSISALAFMLFAGSFSSGAQAITRDVYSWMTRPMIQGRIDAASDGDTICFHAGIYDWSGDWAPETLPFRWENTGALIIEDKTLKIRGEAGTLLIGPPSASDRTRGVNAFKIIDLDTNNDVSFDNMSFQNFLRGISCGYGSYAPDGSMSICEPNMRNLIITNCTFNDIDSDAMSISYITGDVLIQYNDISGVGRAGLFVDWYWSLDHLAWQPESTSILILDNMVASRQFGFIFQQTTNVHVKNNEINARFGIEMNSRGADVIGNSLTDCFQGIDFWGGLHGAVIASNELTNISDYGLRLWSDCQGNIVSKNKLVTSATSWGGIVSNANNNYYGQNRILGTGSTAFYLYGNESASANHETLQANNVNDFVPSRCHFYLGAMTHDNLVVGSGMDYNTYFDLGFDNRITGVISLPGGIGQDLSDAVRLRNEGLKEAKTLAY